MGDRKHGIERRQRAGFRIEQQFVGVCTLQSPPAVTAPGVEGAVVVGFEHGIEDVAVFDDVTTPGAVADVDAGAGHAIQGAVADCDGLRHGDLDGGGLLFNAASSYDQRIFNRAVFCVGFAAGPLREIDCVE